MTKYRYMKVLQGNYGAGWDDLTECDERGTRQERAEFRDDVRACRENEPQYPHRVIHRRVINTNP